MALDVLVNRLALDPVEINFLDLVKGALVPGSTLATVHSILKNEGDKVEPLERAEMLMGYAGGFLGDVYKTGVLVLISNYM